MGSIPAIGESYRGPHGHSGYLLRQAWHQFRGAMDEVLREHGLTGAQFAVLSVLARHEAVSGADLARICNTTPQAMTGVVSNLERNGLVVRQPHPTHGRILEVTLTDEGRKRLNAATTGVRALEHGIEVGLTSDELAVVKKWLVTTARVAATAPHNRPVGNPGSGTVG